MFILATIVLVLVTINTVLIASNALIFKQNTSYSLDSMQALNLAEAGIDKAVATMNASGGSYNGETETELGNGTYEVVVTTKDSSTSIIQSTGYIPNKETSKSKRSVTIEVSKGVGVSFNYGIQVGDGGLYMEQQGDVIGSIYSNGNVILDLQSNISGDVFVAGGVQSTPDVEHDCSGLNCSDYLFGKNISGENRLDVSQSFKVTQTNTVNKVALNLKKIGSPPNVIVRILEDSNGSPNKNNVLAQGVLYASLVTSQYGFAEVTFTSSPTLTSGQTYWLMIDTTSNTNNYWSWSEDSLQSYTCSSTPPCLAKYSANWQASNPVWSTISGDLGFKIFVGGVNTYIRGDNEVDIGGDAHANTLIDLTIDGDAYFQTAQNISASNQYPGSPDPQALPMPISQANIDEWKDQADTQIFTGDITNCPTTLVSGKYIGNITLPQQCTVNVQSPIWVTGNFTMNQQSKLRLDSSYGTSSGVFIVDGLSVLNQHNKLQGSCAQDSCSNGSFLILVSEFNSKDDPKQRYAIHLQQQGNTGVLYSNFGTIRVEQQNDLTEITAWKISLGQQLDITYDQGLAGTFFSSGPQGSFSVIKGTYQAK